MPTVDALQDALEAALGSREPELWQLKQLGEHPLARQARECRAAVAGVPPLFGAFRRGRLVAWDRVTTTWEGWDVEAGVRVLVRAARSDTWGRPVPGHGLEGKDWPFRVSAPFSCSLADLMPLEDPPDPLWAAGLVTAVLADLEQVHATGHPHGLVMPSMIVWDGRWHLLDLGNAEPAGVGEDLAELGRLMSIVDPDGFLGDLGEAFLETAPPSAVDARVLLQRALADQLSADHNRLVRRLRGVARGDLIGSLLDLGRRLRSRCPPPMGVGCVQAGAAGSFWLVVSDGHTVRGGPTASMDIRSLPVIATPDHFDAPANRALLRAWQTRRPGTESLRERLQQQLHSTDADVDAILRWLAAAARLRAEMLLVAARRM